MVSLCIYGASNYSPHRGEFAGLVLLGTLLLALFIVWLVVGTCTISLNLETNILFVTRYSINLVNGVNWVIKFLFLKDFIYNIIKESHLSSKTMCKSYQIIKL